MDFAAYIDFDELYQKFDLFKTAASKRVLTARLLGIVSAFEPEANIIEVLSPTHMDAHPCVLIDVSLLEDDFKQNLAGDGATDRMIQAIGTLKLSPSGKTWCMQAFSAAFMDGVSLETYRKVVELTRQYARAF